MEYKEETKDLFTVSDDYYLAHCISADFALGAGIAVQFNKKFNMKKILRRKYPDYLNRYIHSNIGGDCILEGRVCNLITKERYFNKPTIITMRLALEKMKEICLANNVNKIAMPKIGSGLDKLNWCNVRQQIQEIFKDTDIEILVCKQPSKTIYCCNGICEECDKSKWYESEKRLGYTVPRHLSCDPEKIKGLQVVFPKLPKTK